MYLCRFCTTFWDWGCIYLVQHKTKIPSVVTTPTGPRCNAEAAKKFILSMYVKMHGGHHKPLYTHFTCATDTENIRIVFKAVKDTLFRDNLEKFNLE